MRPQSEESQGSNHERCLLAAIHTHLINGRPDSEAKCFTPRKITVHNGLKFWTFFETALSYNVLSAPALPSRPFQAAGAEHLSMQPTTSRMPRKRSIAAERGNSSAALLIILHHPLSKVSFHSSEERAGLYDRFRGAVG